MPLNVFCSTVSRIATHVQVAKETSTTVFFRRITRQFEKHIEWHAMKSQFGVVAKASRELATRPSHWWARNHPLQLPQLHPSFQSPTFATRFSRDEVRKIDGGANLQNFRRIETTQTICQYLIWELITNARCSSYTSFVFVVIIAFQTSQSTLMSSIICRCFLHFFGMLALINSDAIFGYYKSLKGPITILQKLDFSQLSLIHTRPTSRCHWRDLYMFHLVPWQAALEPSHFGWGLPTINDPPELDD